jgi:hypothetical protein
MCYDYQRGVKNASGDMKNIRMQLISLRDVLERLAAIVDGEDANGSHRLPILESLLNMADGPLVHLKAELDDLEKKLEPASGWKAKHQALVWPLKERDTRKTLVTLESTKATILFALTADQT